MTETAYEQVVEEEEFAALLQAEAELLFRLGNSLLAREDAAWTKRQYFQLLHETDSLESFLDDYGARVNQTYQFFTELVASLRWFAQAGHSVTHLLSRVEGYGVMDRLQGGDGAQFLESLRGTEAFLRRGSSAFLRTALGEAERLRVQLPSEPFSEDGFLPVAAWKRLPRTVGLGAPSDERQHIAEVASKFLQASDVLSGLGIQREDDATERARLLAQICREEQARVYEATVHNLQSAYDTYIKNTVLEAEDGKLPQLRGIVSATLHLLQATTYLTHFYERHEGEQRAESVDDRIAELVERADVQACTLNELLWWSERLMRSGRALAEDLLPEYTNARELVVELSGELVLHARPASLIVGIVNHHGTPVEMEVASQRCNAASILELLVTVGSHPDEKRFTFRGDENPLKDIGLLFQYGLGERGMDALPGDLGYLRNSGD